LFSQGCRLFPEPVGDQLEPAVTSEESEGPVIASPPVTSPPLPGRFTLRYDSNSSLNPITSQSSDNRILSSLLYESLFIIDSNLNAAPVLCESWSNEDEYTYIFRIKPNISMSDGSFLTAEDVAYSIRQASQRGQFVNRLRIVDSVRATGELTVTIQLNTSHRRFIYLLDVPIIKDGSMDSNIPPGSGPYTFSSLQPMRLDGFSRYRDYMQLPVRSIYLVECDDSEMAELFDDGVLSLLWDDPSDTYDIRLNRLCERLYYDTTTLQFIGFNMSSLGLRDLDVRRAISYAIDRQYIIENIMPRQAIASPLAISPVFRLYDVGWEYTIFDPPRMMAELLDRADLFDFDDDTFLEYPDGFGGYVKFSIDFIVNSNNAHKIQVANLIATTLRRTGFDITVRELPWDRFLSALENGEFDMYIGEIELGADFDLSPLLLPNSPLNFGNTGNTHYRPFIEDFLTAQFDIGLQAAARVLCDEITLYSPFVPIVYKKYVLYTQTGAVFGATPSQSGVFVNFKNWEIDLTMLS